MDTYCGIPLWPPPSRTLKCNKGAECTRYRCTFFHPENRTLVLPDWVHVASSIPQTPKTPPHPPEADPIPPYPAMYTLSVGYEVPEVLMRQRRHAALCTAVIDEVCFIP